MGITKRRPEGAKKVGKNKGRIPPTGGKRRRRNQIRIDETTLG